MEQDLESAETLIIGKCRNTVRKRYVLHEKPIPMREEDVLPKTQRGETIIREWAVVKKKEFGYFYHKRLMWSVEAMLIWYDKADRMD